MRQIGSPVEAELLAETLTPIGLVELDFDSGFVRLWTGTRPLSWNGFTWTGVGTLGQIGAIEETSELRAVGLQLSLSGIPTELFGSPSQSVLQITLGETWQNRSAKVYYGVLNTQGVLIGDPFQIFGGKMDQMAIVEGETATITLTCESALIDLERTRARRYTPEDQRAEYPLDAGFDMVSTLQDAEVKWGSF